MLRAILTAALVAGVVAGVVVSALQMWQVSPLIYEAELYETGAAAAAAAATPPAPEVERVALTVLANLITGVGYGLLLTAAIALSGRTSTRQGVVWGIAGFLVFALLPALGLPPKLPGTPVAPLGLRQAWWLATVAAGAVGLGLAALARNRMLRLAGLVVVALPHLVGAPAPPPETGSVPAALSRQFVIASLASAAAFWLVLGPLAAVGYRRLRPAG